MDLLQHLVLTSAIVQVMDDYEEYNYEDYEQDKTRKHGSKKGAAQHKEQSWFFVRF